MNDIVTEYEGLTTLDARKLIVEKLKELGDLVKTEEYNHNVGKCYRCHNTIEPRIVHSIPDFKRDGIEDESFWTYFDRVYIVGCGTAMHAAMIGKKESEISKWLKGTHNFTLRTIAKISAVLEEPIIEVAGEHKTNNEYVFINLIDSSPKTNISNRSKSISIRDNSDYTPVLWNNFSFCTANNDMIN